MNGDDGFLNKDQGRVVDLEWEERLAVPTEEEVRAVHFEFHDARSQSQCWHCGQAWPCATIRALPRGGQVRSITELLESAETLLREAEKMPPGQAAVAKTNIAVGEIRLAEALMKKRAVME